MDGRRATSTGETRGRRRPRQGGGRREVLAKADGNVILLKPSRRVRRTVVIPINEVNTQRARYRRCTRDFFPLVPDFSERICFRQCFRQCDLRVADGIERAVCKEKHDELVARKSGQRRTKGR